MRVYGHDPNDPELLPDREYVELCGGPLDGVLYDVTGMSSTEQEQGALLVAERGAYGPGGRSDYEPGDRPGRWEWQGDVP